MSIRIGQGFDVHAFGDGDHIMLGGVRIPYHQGFIAHSDGDVLIHAICDALLGALALGDIGQHFPDDQNEYKGIDSAVLLQRVYSLIQKQGYQLSNLDSVVIAQAPRLSAHINSMRQSLANVLQVEAGQIGIKATTSEHLGFTGRKEGIAASAVVLISKY